MSFRQRAVEPARAALLVIDLQKGEYDVERRPEGPKRQYVYDRVRDVVIPNGQRLIAACREAGIEVMYTVIECLTKDGRDRGLDYKISASSPPRVVGGRGPRRAAAGRRRHRHPEDVLEPVQLHQLRVRAAQPRRRVRDRHGDADGPVRGDRGPRRLRPRLPDDPGGRRVRHLFGAAPSRGPWWASGAIAGSAPRTNCWKSWAGAGARALPQCRPETASTRKVGHLERRRSWCYIEPARAFHREVGGKT